MKATGPVLLTGRAVGARIASGVVRVIPNASRIGEFKAGEILVTDSTSPDWEPIMRIAAGIITNRGGRTCHAAIVAREFGIPAVIGCEKATEALVSGEVVTVCCAEGAIGKVYQGHLPSELRRTDLSSLQRRRPG